MSTNTARSFSAYIPGFTAHSTIIRPSTVQPAHQVRAAAAAVAVAVAVAAVAAAAEAAVQTDSLRIFL